MIKWLLVPALFVAVITIFRSIQHKKNIDAPKAAGMNVDLENVKPILTQISVILDSGFTTDEISMIDSKINQMQDREVKDIGRFEVYYRGKKAVIRIEAEMTIEDEDKEIYLYMYSDPKLVKILDKEMRKFTDKLGM